MPRPKRPYKSTRGCLLKCPKNDLCSALKMESFSIRMRKSQLGEIRENCLLITHFPTSRRIEPLSSSFCLLKVPLRSILWQRTVLEEVIPWPSLSRTLPLPPGWPSSFSLCLWSGRPRPCFLARSVGLKSSSPYQQLHIKKHNNAFTPNYHNGPLALNRGKPAK